MKDDFEVGIRPHRPHSSSYGVRGYSDDDCPNRAKYLKELEEKRGWEKFTWRERLGESRVRTKESD